MKKYLLSVIVIFSLTSCNMNPSKEDRIQKLETEMQTMTANMNRLVDKVKILEASNEQFKVKIEALDNSLD